MSTHVSSLRGTLILTAGLLALLALASLGPSPAGFWAPEGFVAQADTLIGRGHLNLICSDQDSIVAVFPPESPEEDFFNASYLRADVRTFNTSPDATRSPFLVEGCRVVGVDPFYHRIDLPYNRLPRWRGDVQFTYQGATATLEGGASQELEVRHPVDRGDAAAGSQRVRPDDEGARVYTSLLRILTPTLGAEVLADAFFVGGSPVIADRRDVGSTSVLRVNGFRAPPGRVVRVESGDWVQLADESGAHTYLAETGERARTASFVRMRNDRVDRLYPARRLEPMLRPFAQAMDLALQSIPGAGEGDVVNAEVRLTLDRGLTDALDASVADWCRERSHASRPRATSLLVMDGFSGAVRAMPSCPGVEELGPYEPLSTRTRERFLRNQNLAPHPVGSAAKPFWTAAVATTYPNFLDLEIPAHAAGDAESVLGCPLPTPYSDGHGSGGWTGLEEFLQRSCNRYVVELASAALALGSEETGTECRGPLSARAFAQCLPNALRMRVAEGTTGGATSTGADTVGVGRLRLCDAVVSTVLAPGMEVVGGGCGDLQLVDAKFAPGPAFSALTNVAVYRDPSPGVAPDERAPALGEQYRLGRYRVDAWRTVLGELDAAGDTAHLVQTALRFSAVSPQATNLALNTVEELRTDWVNLVLGGENSRWSNFELAEATARLMSGRGVRGLLADSVGMPLRAPGAVGGIEAGEDTLPLLPESALRDGVRRRVLHAMELAARPGGTAGRLNPAVGRIRARLRDVGDRGGYDLWVFAKTGTPAVEKFVTSAQQRLVQRLYSGGDVSWDGARFRFRPGLEDEIRQSLGSGTWRWLVEDVLQPMERSPARFRAGGEGRLPAHPLYFAADGRLSFRELVDRRVDRQGGVLVLGFLATPADQGRDRAAAVDDWVSACSLDPGLRRGILEVPPAGLLDPDRAVALSVAIYLDDLAPGEGSGFAVDLALEVMDDVGDYLEREVRRKLERALGSIP